MTNFICRTCGCQYGETEAPPEACKICDDERQYIGQGGQQWTTLDEMRAAGYRNDLRPIEPGLHGIRTEPQYGIGQRALLVQTAGGNVLYDGLSYIDDETIDAVGELGGITAMTVSHPHFYASLIEWSHAFGGAPVYIPEADRQWVTRDDPVIDYWSGSVEVVPGVTLIQCGGHFEGSAVLHWPDGAAGRGALMTGDTISVVRDRRFVTFMRSYPNEIPLPESAVRQIVDAVQPYEFDRIYGGWWDSVVPDGAKEAVERSAERYIRWISEPPPDAI